MPDEIALNNFRMIRELIKTYSYCQKFIFPWAFSENTPTESFNIKNPNTCFLKIWELRVYFIFVSSVSGPLKDL